MACGSDYPEDMRWFRTQLVAEKLCEMKMLVVSVGHNSEQC